MSLINDVLQDLDRRSATGDDRRAVPNDVRPLPGAPRPRWTPAALLIAVLGIAGLGGIYWNQQRGGAEREVVASALVPQPVTSLPAPANPMSGAAPEAVKPAPVPSLPAQSDRVPAAASGVKSASTTQATAVRGAAAPVSAVPPAPTSTARAALPAKSESVATRDGAARAERPATLATLARADTESSRRLRLEPVLNSTPVSRDTPGAIDELARAQTMIRLGRVDEAEPILRQLLQTQPRNVTARQALLGILLPAKRHSDAAAVFRDGLQNNPEQVGWAMSLARLQAEAKDPAAALETLAFSRAHAGENPDYLAFSGTLMQRLGRSTDAVTAYDAALRLRPQEPRWWVGFGIALEGAGRARDALEAFSRAKSLGGLSPEVLAYVEEKLR